ncbi:MAG TPA: hypothetical protein VEA69_14935 [Tepidisphaeraceae bacterium]|nr:hypothetical protein [Tepidisphaeraceae bacterium]
MSEAENPSRERREGAQPARRPLVGEERPLIAPFAEKRNRQVLREIYGQHEKKVEFMRLLALMVLFKVSKEQLRATDFAALEKRLARSKSKLEQFTELRRMGRASAADEVAPALRQFVHERVFPTVPWPLPFSAAQLAHRLQRHVMPADEFEDGLYDFAESTDRRLDRLRFRSSPFAVAVVEGPCPLPDSGRTVWDRGRINLRLDMVESRTTWRLSKSGDPAKRVTSRVMARFSGPVSPRSGRRAASEARSLLTVLYACVADIERPGETTVGASGLPRLRAADLVAHRGFVRKAIDMFATPGAGRDTVHGRLRNAIVLMAEANKQPHPALGLGLFCSALEALVGRGADSISKTLSESLATLLEPDPNYRQAAIELVRELYNLRSKTLHGERVEAPPVERSKARALCAHALRAVMEWQEFVRRTQGDTPDAPALFREIESARIGGKRIAHDYTAPVRRLWGAPA